MLALKLVAGLAIVAVLLTGSALLRNRVSLSAPPGFGSRLGTYLTTNVAETRDDHVFPELRTRTFEVNSKTLLQMIEQACAELGWKVVKIDAQSSSVLVEVSTPLLGFRDDLQARVEAAGEQAARLHVVSRSRVGRGDLGANQRHIMDLLSAIDDLTRILHAMSGLTRSP
jgi:uncharacterized protein (DUF1499 family)